MMTKKVKVATISMVAVALAALMLVYPALATPVAATTATSTTSSSSSSNSAASTTANYPGGSGGPWGSGPGQQGGGQLMFGGPQGPAFGGAQKANVTAGETFTVTSTTGSYVVVGNTSQNGTASGTITFTVTGSLTRGDTLSLSGTVVIDGTTYTISSGSAEMNPSATTISGEGTTSPTGQVLLQASAHGSFVGSNGQVSLDLSNGTTEYLVFLSGSITS